MGRKFSGGGAFICSLNEMRMHYTWIAGDINFLPWTCSGPCGRQDGRAVPESRGGDGRARGGGWPSTQYITSSRCVARDVRERGTNDQSTHTATGQTEVVERWEGKREGGGDSTGCFVLTRPTTCELLPGFLPTFASPVILTSGAARCIGTAEKSWREKDPR